MTNIEKLPEKPKGQPSELEEVINYTSPHLSELEEVINYTSANLSSAAEKQMPDAKPLHVEPSDVMRVSLDHKVTWESIAKVTQRIPYKELGGEWRIAV